MSASLTGTGADTTVGTDIWSTCVDLEVPVPQLADADRLQALGMLASALAGRPVAVSPLAPGEPSWT
ncbi:MAG: nitric oxide reductase NorD protein, partial [Mycobacterium sp.]|nr:nitric oxide reductase NorD protein [Mycobacterium sp.]